VAFTYAGRYGADNFIGRDSRPLRAGTVVSVVHPGTDTLADLYTDRDRSASAPNPSVLGRNGNFLFYAEPGDYELVISGDRIPVEATPDARDMGGTPGPPGASGGSAIHDQAVASDTWVFQHNLGYFPTIQNFDTSGEEIFGGRPDHTSPNVTIITWPVPVAGKSYAT
jgi:hypothetical protein